MNGVRKLACGLLCFAAFAAASVVRADNAWTYDSSANPKTISDGNWTIQLIDDYTGIANGVVQLGDFDRNRLRS